MVYSESALTLLKVTVFTRGKVNLKYDLHTQFEWNMKNHEFAYQS